MITTKDFIQNVESLGYQTEVTKDKIYVTIEEDKVPHMVAIIQLYNSGFIKYVPASAKNLSNSSLLLHFIHRYSETPPEERGEFENKLTIGSIED